MRFVQVGVGGFGKGWVRRLTECEHVDLVGLVDVSSEALAGAREVSGCGSDACFDSLAAALASVQADALLCVTPPEYHREPVIEAMEAGLDVISEKPMALCPEDCRAMVDAAERTGRTYVVSQNYRYKAETWTLAQLVKEGRVGEIGQVKIDFYLGHDFHGGFRHSMDYPLLIDMSIHHFDLIRFITGLDAVTVRGEAWNPKWSNYAGDCSSSVIFEMSNGARVIYNASWCAKGQFSNWDGNWQIEGSKGTIVYEGGEIELYAVPDLYTVTEKQNVTKVAPERTAQDYVLHDFMEAVAGRSRAATDALDNINSISMVFAAVDAVRTGERVSIA